MDGLTPRQNRAFQAVVAGHNVVMANHTYSGKISITKRTLPRVEIDCFSFFATGQMGVAVGRAENKARLCILNYNREAAVLKHPKEVYDFYVFTAEGDELRYDLTCCKLATEQNSQQLPCQEDEDDP